MDFIEDNRNEESLTIDALFVDALGLKRIAVTQEDEITEDIH